MSLDQSVQDFSFRIEAEKEELSPIDNEISKVYEDLRRRHPDCDRLGEINAVISHCKEQLAECVKKEDSSLKKIYLDKVVKLNLEKQHLEDNGLNGVLICKGHDFVMQPTRGRYNPRCEVCMHTIWRLVQSWRRCTVCGFRAHDQCCSSVLRTCAGLLASRTDFSLVLTLSVERGLAAQNYSCAECKNPLMFDGPSHLEPKFCDYSGLLFCENCHWGDQWSIPARIVLNMDATPRPVCRAVKQLLSMVDSRPLIDVGSFGPLILKFHKEFARVQELRKNFLYMKCYFISCRNARKLRILQYLHDHQHFVENSNMYSLRELRELCNLTLLQRLEEIHTVFRKHIEEECETCKGHGFYCELCDDSKKQNEIIYPFSEGVAMCQDCFAVFHGKCYERRSMICPRCERRRKRKPISS
ncbi:unnamed protein product [Auanema sp. JU1783]|nr:unnamed protein product [Auanema sp. JU1783]